MAHQRSRERERPLRELLARDHTLNGGILFGLDGYVIEVQARAMEVLKRPAPWSAVTNISGMAGMAVREGATGVPPVLPPGLTNQSNTGRISPLTGDELAASFSHNRPGVVLPMDDPSARQSASPLRKALAERQWHPALLCGSAEYDGWGWQAQSQVLDESGLIDANAFRCVARYAAKIAAITLLRRRGAGGRITVLAAHLKHIWSLSEMVDQAPKKDSDSDDKSLVVSRPPSSPLIFISHDTRDAELAEAFSKLISSVSCGMLKSFRSSDKKGSQGIEYGLEWYPELMGKLGVSTAVVCLLTQRSVDRPWILYEAGVAKGKLDTPVYGVALGISLSKANTGPFAQFQNCDDDVESLTNLVMQLLSRIPNSAPDRDAVKMQVEAFTVKKEQVLKGLGTPTEDDTSSPDASVARLFEEVKLMFQDLPGKVEGRIAEAVEPSRRRRMRRFHPKMFDEFLMMSDETDSSVGLLMMLSYYREEMPWLYDLGKALYDAIQDGNEKKTMNALHQMQSTLTMARHHPLMADMMMSSKEGHMLVIELPRMLEHYVEHSQMRRGSPRSARSKESS